MKKYMLPLTIGLLFLFLLALMNGVFSDIYSAGSSGVSKNRLVKNPDQTASAPAPLKAVRVDLSSMSIPSDQDAAIAEIIHKIKSHNGNAVYLSPWSDGYANYASQSAPLNDLGRNNYVEKFIAIAHANRLRVYAWFVVGKDNFPAHLEPDWYAQTANGQNYQHADEPGINLPFASLANDDYLKYHLKLIAEVDRLAIDGWVISEPLIGWGDIYDDYYTDFSSAAQDKFSARSGIDPKLLLDKNSEHYFMNQSTAYQDWLNFRAGLVTNFVARTMQEISRGSQKPVIITVFTEPGQNGQLKNFAELREWQGTDIPALLALEPAYLEIQALFHHFVYPQAPSWSADMLTQFQKQINYQVPVMVSVQGFDSEKKLKPAEFSQALISVRENGAAGTSFYAYHTLGDDNWEALKDAWSE